MKYLIASLILLSSFSSLAQVNELELQRFAIDFEQKHDRPAEEVLNILKEAEFQQEIIEKISRPAEGTMTWKRYRNIFIKKERIDAGLAFWEEHKTAIARISNNTGVPPEVLLGIIGVETYFGRNKGSYKVLDALYTLGFGYPKRSKFFKSELEKFLLLADSEDLDVFNIKGSYAGAMGFPQFMPSSYIAYAKSYEDGGTIDLMNSPEDAIASVANYIKVHKWQKDQPIASKAAFTREVENLNKQVLRPKNNLSDYKRIGIMPEDEIEGDPKSTLIILESDEEKEYWFGFYNFYVITRYNHSPFYAMAVYELGSMIVDQKTPTE